MDVKKFIIAVIAGTIASFIMGYLIYGLALSGYMADNTMAGVGKEMPDFLWLILGHVFLAAAVTYIFMKWAAISTIVTGMKAAFIIGILISLGSGLSALGVLNVYTGGIVAVLVDAIGSAIIWGAAGAAVGWTLGMGKD